MTYSSLGRFEQAVQIERDVYSGRLRLQGEQNEVTILAANNYASTLKLLERFEEARSLLRRTIPVARHVLGDGHDVTLSLRTNYGIAIYLDTGATLDYLREAVTTLEDTARAARRVLGGANPLVAKIERALRESRAALHARETPPA